MSKINVLPEEIYLKIAAGEVIERPANIVKELIENSIDARAEHIDVYIEDAGKKSITVIDDGEGIDKDDISKTVLSHSTSKIKKLDDLYKIITYGFRGEALASIAAVSYLELASSATGDGEGLRLFVKGGELVSSIPISSKKGTTAVVKNLFFNTPARRKFLRKNITEINLIQEIVLLLSLSNPGIAFQLITDGKIIFKTNKGWSKKEILKNYYGDNICNKLVAFKKEIESPEDNSELGIVSGFISTLDEHLASRNSQFIFVNGRPVTDKMLSYTIYQAYKNYFPSQRHPYIFLFIEINPDLVDVNVHPKKKEVRFTRIDFIQSAVYTTLHTAIKGIGADKFISDINKKQEPRLSDIEPHRTKASLFESRFELPGVKQTGLLEDEEIEIFRIIGQLNRCFILTEFENNLVIFDQHTASERINFNRIISQYNENSITIQNLLIPYSLHYPQNKIEEIKEYFEIMKELGFIIEEFGSGSLIVQGVPSFLGRRISDKNIIVDIIDDLINKRVTNIYQDRVRDIVAIIACKSAVRAGDFLSEQEMRELINKVYRMKEDDGFICPHGRPVFVKINNEEIERMFLRK
ncbi:MAG: DNA mismatch repair endonuclease MutL [Candidatus Hydrogenedentota bacterium]